MTLSPRRHAVRTLRAGLNTQHYPWRASRLAWRTCKTTMASSVRCGMRVLVKRILRKYGYPTTRECRAVQNVLQQV